MRKRILSVLVAINMLLAGGLIAGNNLFNIQEAQAAEQWLHCCHTSIDGVGYCDDCWFNNNCVSDADCQQKEVQ